MRVPKPLPPELVGREFTRAEALSMGVSEQRLRARDIERVARSVYRLIGTEFDVENRARALSSTNPAAWISHETSARLRGLFLPPYLAFTDELHLSVSTSHAAVRQPGVMGHQVILRKGEVEIWNGIRMSTPARTWLDLASKLTLTDAVVLGDQLLRIPRPAFEEREAPWNVRSELAALLSGHPNLPGVVRAREALQLMRVGADSPPETKLRLSMMDFGLPEPDRQVRVDPDDRWSPAADLGYPRQRLAIQYDGGVHLTPEQQARDNRRDETFNVAGWSYFKFNRADLRDGFRRACVVVRGALTRAAA